MKKIVNVLFGLSAIMVCSCGTKSNDQISAPEFPYESYLESMDEEHWSPKIGDDGYGFNGISDDIKYPELPSDLVANQFVDSLLLLYNTCLAYNTLAYDVSTAERYIDAEALYLDCAHAIDSINLSGIKDAEIRDALMTACKKAAYWIKNGKCPNEQKNEDVGVFLGLYDKFLDAFVSARYSKAEYNPEVIIENYAEIHQKAITDTLSYRDELLRMVQLETDFQKKCVLAREFAYANYHNQACDDKELVSIIDPILRSEKFSPLLGELWLIWRTALQGDIFGTRSNDGAMYNLFYNDMRNRVALQYISYLQSHPNDKVAFDTFVRLAMEYNIVRNSGCFFGNNYWLDKMSIYKECLKTD